MVLTVLTVGFPLDATDDHGNTLLIVACQNGNRKLAELLVMRGAEVNLANKEGNTALHFALEYDPRGTLGEYLIEHGADDSLENKIGLTPYDGIVHHHHRAK